jgi:DNA-binding Xre family transcriptional regulator
MSEKQVQRRDWRLPELMVLRRIRFVAALHRMLIDLGIKISSSQVTRMYCEKPKLLNAEVLEGLTTILNCTLDDLMPVVRNSKGMPHGVKAEQVQRVRQSARVVDHRDIKKMTGPKATAFMIPERT